MPIVQSTNSKYLSFENETSNLVEDDSNFPFNFVEQCAFESHVVVFFIFGNGQ